MKQQLKTIKKKISYRKSKFALYFKKDKEKITKLEPVPKPIKIRNPGVDLGRILAMLGIIIHHILLFGKAFNKYQQYPGLKKLNTGVFWHVSTYIFISGYVGYKSTKYSNLLYLWLCVLFYSIGIIKYFSIYKPHIYNKKIELMDFFPVLTTQYWYFTAHFGMYLFLPLINNGIQNTNKSQMKIMLIILIVVYIVLKDYMIPNKDPFKMNSGYSVIWFLIFYSTGAYFGKYKEEKSIIKKKVIRNIVYILIFYISAEFCFILPTKIINDANPNFKDKFILFLKSLFIRRISAVPMILQSIVLILFLTNNTL